MACQHFPDDQTLWLQTRAGEDDIIHLPSGLDRADCERQEEEDCSASGALWQDTKDHKVIFLLTTWASYNTCNTATILVGHCLNL